MKKQTIFTIGHSNKTIVEFINLLKKNGIEILIDVRTFPQSRFCPHFNKKALEEKLAEKRIDYIFRGKNLGGKGDNVYFDEAINELVTKTLENKKLCLMCAEKDYKKCHRYELLSPLLEEAGLNVEHICWEQQHQKPLQ